MTWEYIGKWQHGRYSYKPQNKSGLMQEAYLTKYYLSIHKIYTNYTFCKHKISSSHKRIIRGVNFWQLYLIMSSIHAKDSANAICYKTELNWRPFYAKHTYILTLMHTIICIPTSSNKTIIDKEKSLFINGTII